MTTNDTKGAVTASSIFDWLAFPDTADTVSRNETGVSGSSVYGALSKLLADECVHHDSDTRGTDSLRSKHGHMKPNATHIGVVPCEHASHRHHWRRMGTIDERGTSEVQVTQASNHFISPSDKVETKIRSFLSLTNDWDGDGAEEIPLKAIYESLNFLDTIKSYFPLNLPSNASPSPNGEVLVYWHGPDGYAEANFDRVGRCLGYFEDENSSEAFPEDESIENEVWSDQELFLEHLRNFVQSHNFSQKR